PHSSTPRATFATTLSADTKSRPAAMIPRTTFDVRYRAATQRVRELPIQRAVIPAMQGPHRSRNRIGPLVLATHQHTYATLQTRPDLPGYSEFRQTSRSCN